MKRLWQNRDSVIQKTSAGLTEGSAPRIPPFIEWKGVSAGFP